MEYKLIVFDMDGTLLNSNKQISKKTQEAIARAVAHNKIMILNTGRNPAELEEFYDILPGVRYLNCISGALVYDLKEKKALYQKSFDEDILIDRSSQQGTGGSGIALKNIHHRLQYAFSEKSGLRFTRIENGMQVSILIPRNKPLNRGNRIL